MFSDSHAHLDDAQYDNDRDDTIKRAYQQEVTLVISVGESVSSSRAALALASRYDYIYASVGIHPHHAHEVSLPDIAAVRELAGRPKVVAIGEIGLDYVRALNSHDDQCTLFRKQIAIACDFNLPLIIHNRGSNDDMLAILRSSFSSPVSGCMHCFSADTQFAEECLDLGLYISFAGQVTFAKADELREVVKAVPLERMLIETDCPYLAPVPKRGKRNEPSYICYTAAAIAGLKGVTVEEVAHSTTHNVKQLFKIDA